MTPFLSFVLGKVTVVLLFMLKSVVKKLPQLGYLTDIFLSEYDRPGGMPSNVSVMEKGSRL